MGGSRARRSRVSAGRVDVILGIWDCLDDGVDFDEIERRFLPTQSEREALMVLVDVWRILVHEGIRIGLLR